MASAPQHLRAIRSYYEAEATLRSRYVASGWRASQRDAFIALLQREARTNVIDFGAGPGSDLGGFHAAGIKAVGLDLAIGNAELAHAKGLAVIPADVTRPPIRRRSFGAGWSMSTVMHLDDDDAAQAVASMAQIVAPNGPVWVGVWGGDGAVRWDESKIAGQRRPFHQRTLATNRALFERAADLEHAEEIDFGDGRYQLFHLRAR